MSINNNNSNDKPLYRKRNIFISDEINISDHYYEVREYREEIEKMNDKKITITKITIGPFRYKNKNENKNKETLSKNELYLEDMIKIINLNKDGYSIIPKIEVINESEKNLKTYNIIFNSIKKINNALISEKYILLNEWLDEFFNKIFNCKEFINKNINPECFLNCINREAQFFNIINNKKENIKINDNINIITKNIKKKNSNNTEMIRKKLEDKKLNKKINEKIKENISPKIVNQIKINKQPIKNNIVVENNDY